MEKVFILTVNEDGVKEFQALLDAGWRVKSSAAQVVSENRYENKSEGKIVYILEKF